MPDTLITVEGVSKKFCKNLKRSLIYGAMDIGSELLGRNRSPELRKDEFWAVQDVSFEVKRGECLGLIGHNGAGKSTLLKMLNGLIAPDKGRITMKGRIGALIELGTGFNPILTGRENIYNNGAVLGFSRQEIDRKFDAIVDFAEIGEFIDTPVQNYSSGMKVRLGFAVATSFQPDILILDEVLAVGDAGFRMKSFNRISEIMKTCAVIFVSHSMQTIARTCTHGMLLEKGNVKLYTHNMLEAIEFYFDTFQGEGARIEFNEFAEIQEIKINGEKQIEDKQVFQSIFGEDLVLNLKIKIKSKHTKFCIKMHITDKDMKMVAQSVSNKFHSMFEDQGTNEIEFTFPKLSLIDGEYALTYFIQYENNTKPYNVEILATYRNYTKFKVKGLEEVLYAPIYLISEIEHNNQKLERK